jgi:hypothetical protein
MGLAAHGYITNGGAGVEAFIGAGMTLLGIFWGWWTTSGYLQVGALLKKLTATHTAAAAVEVAKVMPAAVTTGAADKAKAVVAVAGVVKVLIVAFLLSAFLVPTAFAQGRKLNLPIDPLHLNGTQVSGDVTKDLTAIWQKIVAASNVDLTYASALAASAGTPAAKTRKQCWDAIIALNEQANGSALKNPDGSAMARPDPHLFTDIETQAEIVDNLSPQGPLFTSCAGAAEMAKMNVLQFVTAAVTGAATFAAGSGL